MFIVFICFCKVEKYIFLLLYFFGSLMYTIAIYMHHAYFPYHDNNYKSPRYSALEYLSDSSSHCTINLSVIGYSNLPVKDTSSTLQKLSTYTIGQHSMIAAMRRTKAI